MKSLYSPLILIMALVCVSACGNQNSRGSERKSVTRSITGTGMKVRDLDGSGIIGVYEDLLLLRESRDTSRLVIYRMEGDSLIYVKGLINKGRGPREFLYWESSLSGDSLFVSNSDPSGINAIYGLSLKDISMVDDPKQWKEYTFNENNLQTGLTFAKISDGRFIVSGGKANSKQILSVADFKNRTRIPLDFWPADSTQGPLHSKQMVYMQSYLDSQNGLILYSNRNAWYMFIAKAHDEILSIEHIIYSRLPKYKVKPDGNIAYSIDGEYGIIPYTTHEYIYAAPGKTGHEFMENESYKGYPITFGDEIEIYDWNGKFIDNCQTDIPFSSFAVSSDNRYLYTMSLDLDSKESVVQRYELNLK